MQVEAEAARAERQAHRRAAKKQAWYENDVQIPVLLELLHSRRFALPIQEAHQLRPRLREGRRGRIAEPRLARRIILACARGRHSRSRRLYNHPPAV